MDWKKLLKKIPRRQYLRPNPPSKKEKTIGYLILTIVVMIGIAIVVSGRYYDQNLFRLNPKLLNETGGEKVVRVAGGERRGSRDGEPVGINNSESSKPSSNSNLFPETIPGWSRKGDVQRFTTDNLYDKVDGRENLYKSYEFKELLAADFYADGTANRFIQIELFDMTSPRSALGVFTAERPSSPTSANIGRESYVDTNGAFFWKGKYYVRVIGSDNDKSTQTAATTIAQAIAEKLPDIKDSNETAPKDPLPTEGQVKNSAKMIPEAAFNQSFFKNVYSAQYKVGSFELTGFIMTTESKEKALSIIDQYRKAMESIGKLNSIGDGIYHLEAYGTHYVIFAQEKSVGGVMEADDKDAAIKLAKQLLEHTKKSGN